MRQLWGRAGCHRNKIGPTLNSLRPDGKKGLVIPD
jgi:hypothetical protein